MRPRRSIPSLSPPQTSLTLRQRLQTRKALYRKNNLLASSSSSSSNSATHSRKSAARRIYYITGSVTNEKAQKGRLFIDNPKPARGLVARILKPVAQTGPAGTFSGETAKQLFDVLSKVININRPASGLPLARSSQLSFLLAGRPQKAAENLRTFDCCGRSYTQASPVGSLSISVRKSCRYILTYNNRNRPEPRLLVPLFLRRSWDQPQYTEDRDGNGRQHCIRAVGYSFDNNCHRQQQLQQRKLQKFSCQIVCISCRTCDSTARPTDFLLKTANIGPVLFRSQPQRRRIKARSCEQRRALTKVAKKLVTYEKNKAKQVESITLFYRVVNPSKDQSKVDEKTGPVVQKDRKQSQQQEANVSDPTDKKRSDKHQRAKLIRIAAVALGGSVKKSLSLSSIAVAHVKRYQIGVASGIHCRRCHPLFILRPRSLSAAAVLQAVFCEHRPQRLPINTHISQRLRFRVDTPACVSNSVNNKDNSCVLRLIVGISQQYLRQTRRRYDSDRVLRGPHAGSMPLLDTSHRAGPEFSHRFAGQR